MEELHHMIHLIHAIGKVRAQSATQNRVVGMWCPPSAKRPSICPATGVKETQGDMSNITKTCVVEV